MTAMTANELQEQLHSLLDEAEHQRESAPILKLPVGLPAAIDWLKYMAEVVSSGTLSKEVLERQSFAIFRLVTDDDAFEQSEIGQKLLHLSAAMKDVALSSV